MLNRPLRLASSPSAFVWLAALGSLASQGCQAATHTGVDGGQSPSSPSEADADAGRHEAGGQAGMSAGQGALGGQGGQGGSAGTVSLPEGGAPAMGGDEEPPQGVPNDVLAAYVAVRQVTLWAGSVRTDFFGGETQLLTGLRRTLSPPLAPTDTCSRTAPPSRLNVVGFGDLARYGAAFMIDGDTRIPLVPPEVSGIRNLVWFTDPAVLEVEPRYEDRYGFEASGGDLPVAIASDDIVLPAELSLPQLEGEARFELANDTLTWTSASDAPVDVLFFIHRDVSMTDGDLIYCRFVDDGEQLLPDIVLDALQETESGLVSVDARRRNERVSDDGVSLYSVGEVSTHHTLAFGEPCESPELLEACDRYEAATRAIEATCDSADPWLLSEGSLCPSYLAQMCKSCPEYFDCLAEGLECQDTLVLQPGNCSCD